MKKIILQLFFIAISSAAIAQTTPLNYKAFCFYYNWYGSVKIDGQPKHWSHSVLKQSSKDTGATQVFPAGGNIGSNYYPQAGEYSSADSAVIDTHMQQIASAGIGVVVVTWLGENEYTFKSIPIILNAAKRYGVKICFQIEPVARRTAIAARQSVTFVINRFGMHPAFYRNPKTKRPLFFVYDSYVIKAQDWADILTADGKNTIRNTPFDADILGLWVKEHEQQFFLESGFDGFYTYFASSGFTFGSTPANWPAMQQWADANGKIFIPSVGPGYNDSRIRPWNTKNNKNREDGKYYDTMFKAALNSKLKYIGITSFNEWHEGTQIEPAVPFTFGGYKYEDYSPLPPDFYLKRTKYWLSKFK
jgi:glycoprotein endo-alpha-1,2-mannosidase